MPADGESSGVVAQHDPTVQKAEGGDAASNGPLGSDLHSVLDDCLPLDFAGWTFQPLQPSDLGPQRGVRPPQFYHRANKVPTNRATGQATAQSFRLTSRRARGLAAPPPTPA
jgi:hypothetical protein